MYLFLTCVTGKGPTISREQLSKGCSAVISIGALCLGVSILFTWRLIHCFTYSNFTPYIRPEILWLNRTESFIHPSMAAYGIVTTFIRDLPVPVLIKLIWSVIFLTNTTYPAKVISISILGRVYMWSRSHILLTEFSTEVALIPGSWHSSPIPRAYGQWLFWAFAV